MSGLSSLFGGSKVTDQQIGEVKSAYGNAQARGLNAYGAAAAGQRRAYSTVRKGQAQARDTIAQARSASLDLGQMSPDTRHTVDDISSAYDRILLGFGPREAAANVAGRMNIAGAEAQRGAFGAQSELDRARLLSSIDEEDPSAWADQLLGIVGTVVGAYYGGAGGAAAGYQIGSNIT